jgi:hypothetical protein
MKMLDDLAVPDGLRGRAAQLAIRTQQRLYFRDEFPREHPLDSGIDPLMKFFARPAQYKHLASLGG